MGTNCRYNSNSDAMILYIISLTVRRPMNEIVQGP